MIIDRYANDWLAQLDSLSESCDAAGHTYLLLDGAFIQGFHQRFPGKLKFLFQNLPGWRDAVRDVSPFIVRYDRTNLQLKDVLKECDGWPMISAIGTNEHLDALAVRLSRWCVVQATGQHINLRFPDTRRLPDIYHVMSDEQRADILGPAKYCAYMSRDGKWAHLPLDGKAPSSELEPKLSDAQFEQLLKCSEGDSMLAQLDRNMVAKTGTSHSARYNTVCAAIALGKAQKLERGDLLSWCEFSIEHMASSEALPEAFASWNSEQNENQVG